MFIVSFNIKPHNSVLSVSKELSRHSFNKHNENHFVSRTCINFPERLLDISLGSNLSSSAAVCQWADGDDIGYDPDNWRGHSIK